MADWNKPALSDTYVNFLTFLKNRDDDVAKMFYDAPTNPSDRFMRFNRSTNIFEEFLTASWSVKTLAVAGGGTGSTTAVGARTALGLGDMALQTSSAVNITGGTVQGILQVKGGSMTFDADGTRDIGTNAVRPNRVYIKNALVIPAGVDKYATS